MVTSPTPPGPKVTTMRTGRDGNAGLRPAPRARTEARRWWPPRRRRRRGAICHRPAGSAPSRFRNVIGDPCQQLRRIGRGAGAQQHLADPAAAIMAPGCCRPFRFAGRHDMQNISTRPPVVITLYGCRARRAGPSAEDCAMLDFRLIRHLWYFVAVAEEKHFGKAARRLGISQPPLSQQIQILERALGVTLFERSRKGALLTREGMAIFRFRAIAARSCPAASSSAVRDAGRGASTTLVIGSIGTGLFEILPTVVRQAQRRFPDLSLSIVEMHSPMRCRRCRAGRSISRSPASTPPRRRTDRADPDRAAAGRAPRRTSAGGAQTHPSGRT